MAAGTLLGGYLGYCCGVMGLLEGLMGGVMAGTMGAMLSVMMVLDHLNEFLAILFLSFAGILLGLSYMIHKENRDAGAARPAISPYFAVALLAQIAILLVMNYGPRSFAGVLGGA